MISKTNESELDTMHWKANEVIIKAGQKFEFPIEVSRSNSELKYHFETKNNNIHFGITFINEDNYITPIVPLGLVNSHIDPVDGSIDLPDPGQLVITWDNTFSWYTEKPLLYTIDLTMPPLLDASRVLSRLSLYHTVIENTVLEKMSLENTQKEEEIHCNGVRTRITELETELEAIKARFTDSVALVDATRTKLADTTVLLEKQKNALSNYLLKQVFTIAGDNIMSYCEPEDLLAFGCTSHFQLAYIREIENWETYFEDHPMLHMKCQWLKDYYNGYTNDDYSHIYDNLTNTTSSTLNIIQPSNEGLNNSKSEETEETEETSDIQESITRLDDEKERVYVDGTEYQKCSITKFGSNGWYKTEEETLSYIIFPRNEIKLIVGPIPPDSLRNLIELARSNGFLIACPGTEQGHNGYYINKKGVVSKWEIIDNDWKKVRLN